jgi:hypothetical protein
VVAAAVVVCVVVWAVFVRVATDGEDDTIGPP